METVIKNKFYDKEKNEQIKEKILQAKISKLHRFPSVVYEWERSIPIHQLNFERIIKWMTSVKTREKNKRKQQNIWFDWALKRKRAK